MNFIGGRIGSCGVVLLAGLALAPTARAQATQPTKQPARTLPAAPGGTAAHGVIKPPHGIDPGIHATPPETGTMPVIPPPGTPGGARGVVPK